MRVTKLDFIEDFFEHWISLRGKNDRALCAERQLACDDQFGGGALPDGHYQGVTARLAETQVSGIVGSLQFIAGRQCDADVIDLLPGERKLNRIPPLRRRKRRALRPPERVWMKQDSLSCRLGELRSLHVVGDQNRLRRIVDVLDLRSEEHTSELQ